MPRDREEIPPYPRDGRGPMLGQRLDSLRDELSGAVTMVDGAMTDVEDAFAAAFAQEDARAATRSRLDRTRGNNTTRDRVVNARGRIG
jgi:hypothetical protein